MLLKRAPFNGMRGKRAPFNGMRGKRGDEELEFLGDRGDVQVNMIQYMVDMFCKVSIIP